MATNNNVVTFPRRHAAARGINSPRSDTADAFKELTAVLVMDRARRGELEPEMVAAFLAGLGFQVPQ